MNVVKLKGDQIAPTNNSVPGSYLSPSGGGGGVVTVSTAISGGEVASVDFGQDVEVFMNLPALATDQIGMKVTTHIVPAVDGTTTVSLNRVVAPEDPYSMLEQITSVDVVNEGDADILAEDLDAGNTYRLVIHYSAGAPLMGVPGASAKMTINNVIYSVVTKVAQTYVAMSCDTDGSFDGSYRYGFNGQQKTNEIAGVGNHNTALFWEYDTRTGRRWNLDPKPNPWESQYSTFGENPIANDDLNGDQYGYMGLPRYVWESAGAREPYNQADARQMAIEFGKTYLKAYGEVMLLAIPVEDVAAAGGVVLLEKLGVKGATQILRFGAYEAKLSKTGDVVQAEIRVVKAEDAAARAESASGTATSGARATANTNTATVAGNRRKNWIPDRGTPNTIESNPSGTTIKKYGPDGNVQKQYNDGHGPNAPVNEQGPHVHDYKPIPQNPSGRGQRMPGRPLKKNELKKDFGR